MSGSYTELSLNSITKEWQRRLPSEMRHRIVQKMIIVLQPTIDMSMINCTDYAQCLESEIFDNANNQEDYFHKITEKMHHIQTKPEQSTTQLSSTIEQRSSTSPQHDIKLKQPIQFTPEELRTHLEPVIHRMIACKYSSPFQQQVDPMNILTMHNKLLRGEYKTPLEFCDDAWLMFNNAWLYNEETTSVYQMCTKLSEIFVDAIDPVVQSFGYCCGRQYFYSPPAMRCYGKQLGCQIPCDEIPKHLFFQAKNDIQQLEAIIDCTVCTRRWHQVCALHIDQISAEGFICKTCMHECNIKPQKNCYTASQLSETELSKALEKRVNNFLRSKDCQTGCVTIRVLSASEKICQIQPQLKNYYENQVPDGYPYRAKAIFAFQEIDDVDVVIFGMYVQEYDDRCQTPNARRVYISLIDSIDYFQPKVYSKDVYCEILIGYFDYVKQLGYVYAHVRVCPLDEHRDYIFNGHPIEQHTIELKVFQDWFKTVFDKATLEGVIIKYKDVMQDCRDNQVQTALDIPYFHNDFWPYTIEKSIQELEDVDLEPEDSTEVSAKRKLANIDQKKSSKKPTMNRIDLISKIFSNMEKHKQLFFVVHLCEPMASCLPINDPDTSIECRLIDTRNAFLKLSHDKHYEFSTLRRAKFSTMALVYELHRYHQPQRSMQRCIEALLHAVNCRNASCTDRSCFRYKRVIQHTKDCKGKNSQCNVCKQVIFLCWYHAKSCNDQVCQVPFCRNLKAKITSFTK